MRRKIIRIRIPKSSGKIIESINTGSNTEIKSTEDGIKRIDFKLSSSVSNERDFKINRQKIRTLHAGQSSWSRSKLGILGSKQFISVRKLEAPEMFNGIICITGKNIQIRILFMKISNNKVLVVSMAAAINRYHRNHPLVDKIYSIGFTTNFE